jgi:hypothetical protein
MVVRFLHVERGRVGEGVRARVAALAQTRSVLVVSARLAAPVLRRELEAEGVDLSRVFILDVTSHAIPPASRDPEHEAYLPGPAMLELITKRAEQVVRSKAERPATVLTDDVATFAQYNPPEALAEILRQAAAVRGTTTELEYVVSGAEPAALALLADGLSIQHVDVLTSGEVADRTSGVPVEEARAYERRGSREVAPGPARSDSGPSR